MEYSSNLSVLYNALPEHQRQECRDERVRDLHRQWKNGSREAMNVVVTSYVPLCIKISRDILTRYNLGHDARQDMEQYLLEKVADKFEKFDPSKDNLFHTYLNKTLPLEGLNFVKKYLGLTTDKHKDLFFNLGKYRDAALEENEYLTRSELAEKIIELSPYKISERDIYIINAIRAKLAAGEIRERLTSVYSQDDDFENLRDITRNETRPEVVYLDAERQGFAEVFAEKASDAITDPIGWYIVKRWVMDDDPVSLVDLGRELDIDERKVRRILDKSLDQLKKRFYDEKALRSDSQSIVDIFEFQNKLKKKPSAMIELNNHNEHYKGLIKEAIHLHVLNEGEVPHRRSGKVKYGEMAGLVSWEMINRDLNNGNVFGVGNMTLKAFHGREFLTLENVVDSIIETQKHGDSVKNESKEIEHGKLQNHTTWSVVHKALSEGRIEGCPVNTLKRLCLSIRDGHVPYVLSDELSL
ncbi:MAG: hypothetical protein ACRBDI_04130 [Alphaproteobacteria bacterium]